MFALWLKTSAGVMILSERFWIFVRRRYFMVKNNEIKTPDKNNKMFALSSWLCFHDSCIPQLSPLNVNICLRPSLVCLSNTNKWWERNNKSGLDKWKELWEIRLICVTSADSRWETDKWPVSVQLWRSHDVTSIYKWQMFVKYTSRGNAAQYF